jgi:hypothetical protein
MICYKNKIWSVDDRKFIELYNDNKNYLITDFVTFFKIQNNCAVFQWNCESQDYELSNHILEISTDNNDEIMELLQNRLALGKERYGHGVRIDDDTRQWGTAENSWEIMMLEEALDGMIYAAACILKCRKNQKRNEESVS